MPIERDECHYGYGPHRPIVRTGQSLLSALTLLSECLLPLAHATRFQLQEKPGYWAAKV